MSEIQCLDEVMIYRMVSMVGPRFRFRDSIERKHHRAQKMIPSLTNLIAIIHDSKVNPGRETFTRTLEPLDSFIQ